MLPIAKIVAQEKGLTRTVYMVRATPTEGMSGSMNVCPGATWDNLRELIEAAQPELMATVARESGDSPKFLHFDQGAAAKVAKVLLAARNTIVGDIARHPLLDFWRDDLEKLFYLANFFGSSAVTVYL